MIVPSSSTAYSTMDEVQTIETTAVERGTIEHEEATRMAETIQIFELP
jgi:hypothetical protein